jgi:hypothetical protein
MRPIGLTLKRSRNKYTVNDGELMLIHQCLGCGKLSINRIAADDNSEKLLAIFNDTACIEESVRRMLISQQIRLLWSDDLNIVLSRLYGKGESLSQVSMASQVKLAIGFTQNPLYARSDY